MGHWQGKQYLPSCVVDEADYCSAVTTVVNGNRADLLHQLHSGWSWGILTPMGDGTTTEQLICWGSTLHQSHINDGPLIVKCWRTALS